MFGSVLTEDFDPARSDIDFLVDFHAGRDNVFHDYFDLAADLECIVGRTVDLVMADAVKNPYFAKAAFESAEDVFAA